MATKFAPSEIEQYYRLRLDGAGLSHSKGLWHRSKCILHGGDNASVLAVNFEDGHWACFACHAKGRDIFSFEQELLRRQSSQNQAPPYEAVLESIQQVLGTPFVQRVYPEALAEKKPGAGWDRSKARDSYRYTDELGRELFTVWRFVDSSGRKITPPDHPCPCQANPDAECETGCVNGRVWGSNGCRRVLYRLPDVMQSIFCFIVEGEKNSNDLSRALALHISKEKGIRVGDQIVDRVAVTTNVGGSSGWKTEHGYGRYFFGKVVVKLGDNDDAGRKHTEEVCRDVSKYASQLFTLDLPVGEGEDVSDYLVNHTAADLLALLEKRKPWTVAKHKEAKMSDDLKPRVLLVKPSELVRSKDPQGDWLVPGIIERGTRGLVVAPPKCGKSLLFLDMAVALASQQGFLGAVPYSRPVKCAIISREDGPDLVWRRLSQLASGRGVYMPQIDPYIRVNTVEQSANFHVDVQADLEEMASWLRAAEIEFVVVDVLNRLHFGEENSTDSMTKVMLKFDELAELSGAQVCVIHHAGRTGNSRGSSSIEGWADFIVKLEADSQDESLKTVTIRTKASGAVKPRHVQYWQSEDQTDSQIRLVKVA